MASESNVNKEDTWNLDMKWKAVPLISYSSFQDKLSLSEKQ